MKGDSHDPLLAALSDLAAPVPRATRDAIVRARCHAAMQSPRRPEPTTHAPSRAIDRLLPVAVLVYAIVVVAEAIRLGWLSVS